MKLILSYSHKVSITKYGTDYYYDIENKFYAELSDIGIFEDTSYRRTSLVKEACTNEMEARINIARNDFYVNASLFRTACERIGLPFTHSINSDGLHQEMISSILVEQNVRETLILLYPHTTKHLRGLISQMIRELQC
jgi:hypothetical protein